MGVSGLAAEVAAEEEEERGARYHMAGEGEDQQMSMYRSSVKYGRV